MNVRLLIDSIMRQTTVLIAELSTNAGVRAPLAHIADQVFLSLSKEIEAQGVARKVVADMFGLALRGYQRKTRRLASSVSVQGKTLFEAVLEFIEEQGGATRRRVLQRFRGDGERETIGVLSDLIQSGLAYSTGSGEATLYGITSDGERQRLTRESDETALANMSLGEIYRNPGITAEALAGQLNTPGAEMAPALQALKDEGRITADAATGALRAATFQLPAGAPHGWESAVFDHFQAVATAIASKLRLRAQNVGGQAYVGGTTLRFELHRNHPLKGDVLALLEDTRERTQALWQRVGEYNDQHPVHEDERAILTFYYGQNIDAPVALVDDMEIFDE